MEPIKVLLVSRNLKEAQSIEIQLKAQGNYEVFVEKTAKSILNRMRTTAIDLLIMNLDYFGPNQLVLIDQIRALKKRFKIVILADRVNDAANAQVEEIPNVMIMGKSFISIDHDFRGFLNRYLSKEKIAKRKSKRLMTKQPAMVKSSRSGAMISCTLFNLSTSGAYLEFDRGHIAVSENVQIIVPLGQLNKTHILRCKIAWIQVSATGKRSAGLFFSK